MGGGNVYYDGNFNLIWTGSLSPWYDSANRLMSVTSGENYGEFTYDGLGRCLKRTVDWETTIIVYDGWRPTVEWNEWDGLKAWNIYGAGPDEILYRHDAYLGDLRYHLDRMGNVAFLLDSDGDGIERYTYDAFGQPTVTEWNGQNSRTYSWYGNRFMFTGREYFGGLGIYDYRTRFYHPVLGRFLQSDPMSFGAGDANLFRYCGGDPVNGIDPDGLWQLTIFAAWKGGAYGTFGFNNGQWNFGAALGVGFGVYIGFAPLPAEPRPNAINNAVVATVGTGFPGVYGGRITGYFGQDGNRVTGTGRLGHVSYGFETDGKVTRLNQSPTFSFGGGFFIGLGTFVDGIPLGPLVSQENTVNNPSVNTAPWAYEDANGNWIPIPGTSGLHVTGQPIPTSSEFGGGRLGSSHFGGGLYQGVGPQGFGGHPGLGGAGGPFNYGTGRGQGFGGVGTNSEGVDLELF